MPLFITRNLELVSIPMCWGKKKDALLFLCKYPGEHGDGLWEIEMTWESFINHEERSLCVTTGYLGRRGDLGMYTIESYWWYPKMLTFNTQLLFKYTDILRLKYNCIISSHSLPPPTFPCYPLLLPFPLTATITYLDGWQIHTYDLLNPLSIAGM